MATEDTTPVSQLNSTGELPEDERPARRKPVKEVPPPPHYPDLDEIPEEERPRRRVSIITSAPDAKGQKEN